MIKALSHLSICFYNSLDFQQTIWNGGGYFSNASDCQTMLNGTVQLCDFLKSKKHYIQKQKAPSWRLYLGCKEKRHRVYFANSCWEKACWWVHIMQKYIFRSKKLPLRDYFWVARKRVSSSPCAFLVSINLTIEVLDDLLRDEDASFCFFSNVLLHWNVTQWNPDWKEDTVITRGNYSNHGCSIWHCLGSEAWEKYQSGGVKNFNY